VDIKIKLFLDIKRELEQQLKDLQNSFNEDASKNAVLIESLKKQNEEIRREIEEKEKKINELTNTIQNMLMENNRREDDIEETYQDEDDEFEIDPPGPEQAESGFNAIKEPVLQFIYRFLNRRR